MVFPDFRELFSSFCAGNHACVIGSKASSLKVLCCMPLISAHVLECDVRTDGFSEYASLNVQTLEAHSHAKEDASAWRHNVAGDLISAVAASCKRLAHLSLIGYRCNFLGAPCCLKPVPGVSSAFACKTSCNAKERVFTQSALPLPPWCLAAAFSCWEKGHAITIMLPCIVGDLVLLCAFPIGRGVEQSSLFPCYQC